jgi:hypothetical protein
MSALHKDSSHKCPWGYIHLLDKRAQPHLPEEVVVGVVGEPGD